MFPGIWEGLLAETIIFPIASLVTADFWMYRSVGLILLTACSLRFHPHGKGNRRAQAAHPDNEIEAV
jgi:hypothetical protein